MSEIQSIFAKGVTTQATIVEVEYYKHSKPGSSPSYTPIFSWTTETGQNMREKADFASPSKDTYRINDSLNVVYDPINPDRYYFFPLGERPSIKFLDYLFLIVGGFFFVTGTIRMII